MQALNGTRAKIALLACAMAMAMGCGGEGSSNSASASTSGAGGGGGAAGAGGAGGGMPIPQGCIDPVGAGDHVYDCDGLKYDVTVPDACVSSACGLVVDVHGFSMSGKMEDNNTNMRALGRQHGYVVVQPNADPAPPMSSWDPALDDEKVLAVMQTVMAAYHIDPKRVHMTGFSQGGMMSWRFVCKYADVLASAAPAAGAGCAFDAQAMPSRQIPVLFLHGTTDALVSFDGSAVPQRDATIAGWQMTETAVVTSDAQHIRTRYESASGNVFEFLQHDYSAQSTIIAGHCFPGSQDFNGGEPGQFFGFACLAPNAFTWGEEAIQFFMAHPAP